MSTYSGWLRGLGEARLAEVLQLRADARRPPYPKSTSELAERLASPQSVSQAFANLDVRCVELLEVLQTLGDGVTRGAPEEFIHRALPSTEIDAVIERLEQRTLSGIRSVSPGPR